LEDFHGREHRRAQYLHLHLLKDVAQLNKQIRSK
jgi:hypothetical protein